MENIYNRHLIVGSAKESTSVPTGERVNLLLNSPINLKVSFVNDFLREAFSTYLADE